MKRLFLALTGWMLCLSLQAQSPQYRFQYWFDGNYADCITDSNATGLWQTQMEIGHLSEGFHTLYLHFQDTSGRWSSPRSYLFYHAGDTANATGHNYVCWFDQDYTHRTKGNLGGDILVDVSTLRDGFHTLNVQTGGGRGVALQSFLFYKMPTVDSADFGLPYFCWFNEDIENAQSGELTGGNLLLDVSTMRDGFHTANIQVGTGTAIMLKSALFYKMPVMDSSDMALTYVCWFDLDYVHRTSGDIGTGSLLFDISELANGFHTVNLQLGGGRGAALQSWLFYKRPAQDSADMALAYTCWFDNDYAARTSGNITGGSMLFDVSSLRDGFHTVNMQLGGGRGAALQSWMFYKMPLVGLISDSSVLTWHYSIDGRDYPPLEVSPSNGLIHLELNVDSLMPGLHGISYYMTASDGNVSALKTSWFYRSGTGVTSYEYWFNGQDSLKTVVNMPAQDTLRIISMLNVPAMPIRSTCFQFDPNGGSPVIYAKNDISFRFWTGDSRFIDRKSYYVDEYVKDTIIADTLIPHITSHCTFVAPTANNIWWYRINAQIGDSIAVMASRSAMLQLFAPNGDEVYSASDLKSIKYDGCNIFEDGYYYLAVHDVAPSNDSLTIYYKHIGKFAILAHTPDNIGNMAGSYFDMELLGNGMMQLDSVWLTQGFVSLTADTIVANGRTRASVVFQVGDTMPNGFYSAYFRFKDSLSIETVIINNAILFEPVNWGEIAVTYSTPSRMAKPYPVVVTLENTGNMDLTYVPFNMAVDNLTSINRIYLENFSISTSPLADSTEYIPMIGTQNLLGRQIEGGMIFSFIPIIRAKEKMRFVVSFDAPAHTRFNFWAWTDSSYEQTSLYSENLHETGNKKLSGAKAPEDPIIAARYSNTQRAIDLVGEGAERLPNPAGDVVQRGVNVGRTTFEIGGTIGSIVQALQNREMDAYEDDLRYIMGDDDFEEARHHLMSPEQISPTWGGRMMRAEQLMQRQRHCAQQPTPDPGTPEPVHVVVPGDPNDIIGYTAESGSHYIRRGITNISYEIEFENDTSLASAAAHTIIVHDTLDASRFQYSSFNWTGVRIGSHSLKLEGGYQTIKTIDLRPDLDVVAQVELDFDNVAGVARAKITSLDPMTLMPTTDPNQGALPINYIGTGVGSVMYNIGLLGTFPDGDSITNSASIVFDNEDAILTPVWVNIVDDIDPVSNISHAVTIEDSTTLYFQGSDNRSDIWRYTLYGRQDTTQEWTIVANNIEDNHYQVAVNESMVYYMVTATDSAGNREVKTTEMDFTTTEGVATYYTVTAAANGWQGMASGGGRIREYRSATLTATPSHGYHFVSWNDGDTSNPRLITVRSDTSLTALFEVNQYQITAECDNWERGIVYGNGLFDYLTNDTITAVAAEHHHFLRWSDGNTDNPRIVTVTCDSVLTALFAIDTHNVTLQGDEAIVSVTGGGSYPYGTEVTIQATMLSPCHSFTAWNSAGSTVGTNGAYTFTLNGDIVLSAQYQPITFSSTEQKVACNSFVWHGNSYTETGNYTFATVTADGCDSTATLQLTINRPKFDTVVTNVCDIFVWEGSNYTSTGLYSRVYHPSDSGHCDSTSVLNLTVRYSTIGEESIEACENYIWHQTEYSATGNYTFTSQGSNGCDSTTTLYLTINQPTSATVDATSCDSYSWMGTTYTQSGDYIRHDEGSRGCDSTTTLHLTINNSTTGDEVVTANDSYTWHGTTYVQSGNYTWHTQNADGCDSTATLQLTILYSTTGSEVVSACVSYTWHGSTYSQSGVYTFDTINVAGADSTITLYLTINQPTVGGEAVTVCDSYSWHGTTYSHSGNYTYYSIDSRGCDSTATLSLTINSSSAGTEQVTACESYTWHESTYTESGTQTYHTNNALGCDSTVTLHLTINRNSSGVETVTACDNYTWHGQNYNYNGIYNDMITNAVGCDSVVTLYLTLTHSTTGSEEVAVCDNFIWHGSQYTTSGTQTWHTTNAAGCDSTATLYLTINHASSGVEMVTACDNYAWHGTTYNASTNTSTYTTTNVAGCDSTVTLHLTMNRSNSRVENVTACDSYVWHGNVYDVSTNTPTFTTTNIMGCDSVITLNLTVNYSNSAVETVTACNSYVWHGTEYTTATEIPTYISQNVVGCDSVTTLNLTIQHCSTTEITACDNYTWRGVSYSASGTYYDGTDTLLLTIKQSTTDVENVTACDSYSWHGMQYTASTTSPTFTSENVMGCDSVTTLNLTINYSSDTTETVTACNGYFWHGMEYTASTNTPTYTTENAVGCDSVTTLHLTINYCSTTEVIACDNYSWHGTIYTASGTYVDGTDTLLLTINYSSAGTETVTTCDAYTWIDGNTYTTSNSTAQYTLTNSAGCDSVTALQLTINYSSTSTEMVTACDNYIWNGELRTENGDYSHQTMNAVGCDSVVTLILTINYSNTGDTIATACDSFTWWNMDYTTSTDTATHTLTNVTGCDSTVTLHLTINYSAETTVADTASDSYPWHDSSYIESGTYQWHGTTTEGCDSTVTLLLVINSVGIEVIDGNGVAVNVYPNPTTGWINIDADDVLSVEVFDQAGRKVMIHGKTNRIDLSGLATGNYMLRIHLQRGDSVQRVILK